jgi:hypothetical protein
MEIIPSELKLILLTKNEREKFDTLTKEDQDKILYMLDLETMVPIVVALEGSNVASLRLIIKALDIAVDHLPDRLHKVLNDTRDMFYTVLSQTMMTVMDGNCPDCGEPLEEHSDESHSIN